MRATWEQLDFFPAPVTVEALDRQRVAGAQSHVRAVYAVRLGHDRRLHRVFDDRHGLYCEEHGPGCEAVSRVRSASAAPVVESRAARKRRSA